MAHKPCWPASHESRADRIACERKGEVEFLYPNGSVADKFSYKGKTKETESFSRIGDEIVVSAKTPAEKNAAIQRLSGESPAALTGQKKTAGLPQPEVEANNTQVETASVVLNSQNNEADALKQEANVLQTAENSSKPGKWLLIILGVSIFSGAGFWVLRKSV